MISIEVADCQRAMPLDLARLRRAAQAVLTEAGTAHGELSIAVVDDPAIQALNRQYLEHDYPTDVLSFLLHRDGPHLEGEVVVSTETALRAAPQIGWAAADELLLYVVHGTLHLVGYDDSTPAEREQMRNRERFFLEQLGAAPSAHLPATARDD